MDWATERVKLIEGTSTLIIMFLCGCFVCVFIHAPMCREAKILYAEGGKIWIFIAYHNHE